MYVTLLFIRAPLTIKVNLTALKCLQSLVAKENDELIYSLLPELMKKVVSTSLDKFDPTSSQVLQSIFVVLTVHYQSEVVQEKKGTDILCA